jgi:hypothetical protein
MHEHGTGFALIGGMLNLPHSLGAFARATLTLGWALALVVTRIAVCEESTPVVPDPLSRVDSLQRDLPTIITPDYWLGEEMTYKVMFGFVPAGKAKLAVIDTARIDGQLVMRAVSSARSAKAYDLIYKVRDTIETWIDADSVYTHQFRKRLHEGNYNDDKLVKFDLANWRVHWWDDAKEKSSIAVPPRVQDVLSAGFKARLLPLAVGDTMYITTHDVNKTYDLMVITHARETVECDLGSFDCLKVEPVFRSGGLFKKERGARVFVWVTNDQYRIPVRVQSRVSFGSFVAQLDNYVPPLSRRGTERLGP